METELTISVNGHQGTGGEEDGPACASVSAADSADNFRLLPHATLDPTVIPSQNGRQAPAQDEGGTPRGPRPAAASTDNFRLLRDIDLIAKLRADLAKAERRAELAEARVKKPKRKRPKRPYETPEFAEAQKRSMRAWGLRVAAGDPSDLRTLRDFATRPPPSSPRHGFPTPYDDAVRVGAQGLHANGASWTEIAAACGITRQGALKRWGGPDVAPPVT